VKRYLRQGGWASYRGRGRPSALAEFERDIIRERTQAGLTAARARGRNGGRPRALTPRKAAQLKTLYNDKTNTIDEICRTLNISRATLYRYIGEK
jgi:DNA invertase Pin-like site-specific DNA recombinase